MPLERVECCYNCEHKRIDFKEVDLHCSHPRLINCVSVSFDTKCQYWKIGL